MRTVSFCFDDGFEATAAKVWRAFDQRRIAASFCVLAAPELAEDPFIRGAAIADWGFWREARAAGHEVAPHGYAHERLDLLTPREAEDGLLRTLAAFVRELPGFRPDEALFHLAYLAAPQAVVDFLSARTLGVRRALGGAGLNSKTGLQRGGSVDCITFGPGADETLPARLGQFLDKEEGWLVLVLHGLDGEGWGTLASATLQRQLDRLLEAGVDIAPAGAAMKGRLTASPDG